MSLPDAATRDPVHVSRVHGNYGGVTPDDHGSSTLNPLFLNLLLAVLLSHETSLLKC